MATSGVKSAATLSTSWLFHASAHRSMSAWVMGPAPEGAHAATRSIEMRARSIAGVVRKRLRLRSGRPRGPRRRVDLGHISPGEVDHGGLPTLGAVGLDERRDPCRPGLAERPGQVRYLVTGGLATVGVGQVAVRDERYELAEGRLDADAPVGLVRASNLLAGRLRIVGHDRSPGESH